MVAPQIVDGCRRGIHDETQRIQCAGTIAKRRRLGTAARGQEHRVIAMRCLVVGIRREGRTIRGFSAGPIPIERPLDFADNQVRLCITGIEFQCAMLGRVRGEHAVTRPLPDCASLGIGEIEVLLDVGGSRGRQDLDVGRALQPARTG